MSTTSPTDRAAIAREAMMRQTAERRAADPAMLAKAMRTVEAAPALTAEQVERLRALLPPVPDRKAAEPDDETAA